MDHAVHNKIVSFIWSIADEVVNREGRRELDLYKRYASDDDFKRAFDASIMRILQQNPEVIQELSARKM